MTSDDGMGIEAGLVLAHEAQRVLPSKYRAIDTEVFAILTNEDMAGKTSAQTLELFDAEIDRVIARIPSLLKA